MINPFERFYDTEIEIYTESAGGYTEKGTKTLLGRLICDLQPYSDDAQSRIYGLNDDRRYKIYSDQSPLLKDGRLVLFAGAWYRIVRCESWSFGMTAVMRSIENEN